VSRRALVCALVATAFLASAGCGGVRMSVIDAATGDPVSEAVIDVRSGGDVRRLGITGDHGRAEVSLPERIDTLSVHASGYQAWSETRTMLARRGPGAPVTVRLQPTWVSSFMTDGERSAAAKSSGPCHCPGR
jgi:hypothetical protein